MEAPRTRRRADGSPSARTLLLTVLGEYVRYAGDERVWSRAVIGALGDCGVGEAATRRAVTRLVQEGWLRTETAGRWTRLVLEPRLVALLTAWTHRLERAVDETPWHGEWRQLLLRAPAGAWRDRALVEEQLAFEGFGSLGQGVWIAADTGGVAALRDLLREQGLDRYASWLRCRVDSAAEQSELVGRAWDLGEVRAAHEDFLTRFGGSATASPLSAGEAFVLRTRLVHAWRGTFERDPRLPGALLPPDWPGFTATELFVDTWRALRGPADRRWERLAADPRG
ncbi:PaaX family transcriptional regulator C-terminal domain-containing protein [Streptomyces sp. NPDC048441]|uniref:PaaX family transcriptional regulator n=1 Tax=Streptomyces sp. NPDC048441 TaxID=3365552 RepID=UPI00371926E4